jgi:hypothetical protein
MEKVDLIDEIVRLIKKWSATRLYLLVKIIESFNKILMALLSYLSPILALN